MKEKDHMSDAQNEPSPQKAKKSPKAILKKIKLPSLSAFPWSAVGRWTVRFVRRRVLPIGCFLLCLIIVLSLLALAISSAVKDKTNERILTSAELSAMALDFDYILILGCGVYSDGSLTPMLADRVQVGVSLYQIGIGNKLLMSGDHHTESYNEVDPMKNTAISMGVAPEAIVTDPYGLSTYDSIARLADEFDASRVLIVTQAYHLPRALYLADRFGIEAYGVSADLRTYRGQIKYDIREMFARCKDVYYAEARPPVASPDP